MHAGAGGHGRQGAVDHQVRQSCPCYSNTSKSDTSFPVVGFKSDEKEDVGLLVSLPSQVVHRLQYGRVSDKQCGLHVDSAGMCMGTERAQVPGHDP